jgi:cytochrome c oxidase subunit 1
MTLMSNALHRAGLAGIPRRTAEPEYRTVTYDPPFGTVEEMQWQIALGGVVLFISLVFFLVVIVASWRNGPVSETIDDTIPPPLSGSEYSPKILDNMKLWIGIAVLLVILAYSLPLAGMVMDGLFAPGAPPTPV